MKSKFHRFSFSLLLVFVATNVHAVLLSNAVLMFDSPVYGGTYGTDVVGGTFFSFDIDNDGDIAYWERFGMEPNEGIVLGTSQAASGSHSGVPDGTESYSIDKPWSFFANTGMHLSNTPVTVLNASGNYAELDMSGWGITWNGIPNIPFGSGSWGSNPEGRAVVTCDIDCSIGDRFTLYYTATVPIGDPSGFGGVRYRLGLDGSAGTAPSSVYYQAASYNDSDPGMAIYGTISAPLSPVPLPAPIWLFGSGLLGLVGMARRKAA